MSLKNFFRSGAIIFCSAIACNALAQAPTLTTDPADFVGTTYARLKGSVDTIGSSAPDVTVYYGLTDGAMVPANWDDSISMGTLSAGDFNAFAYNLISGTNYYFSVYGSNDTGTAWGSSLSFTTEVSGVVGPSTGQTFAVMVDTNGFIVFPTNFQGITIVEYDPVFTNWMYGLTNDGWGNTNFVPDSDAVWSLGESNKQWKSLWVESNTIYIGYTPLTVQDGNLFIGGEEYAPGGGVTNGETAAFTNLPIQYLHETPGGSETSRVWQAGEIDSDPSIVLERRNTGNTYWWLWTWDDENLVIYSTNDLHIFSGGNLQIDHPNNFGAQAFKLDSSEFYLEWTDSARVNLANKTLVKSAGTETLNWETRRLLGAWSCTNDDFYVSTLKMISSQIIEQESGDHYINLGEATLYSNEGKIDWDDLYLYGDWGVSNGAFYASIRTLDGMNLESSANGHAVNLNDAQLYAGGTTLDWDKRQLMDEWSVTNSGGFLVTSFNVYTNDGDTAMAWGAAGHGIYGSDGYPLIIDMNYAWLTNLEWKVSNEADEYYEIVNYGAMGNFLTNNSHNYLEGTTQTFSFVTVSNATITGDVTDEHGHSIVNHHYANGYTDISYPIALTAQNEWYPATNWVAGEYCSHVVFTNNGIQLLEGTDGVYLIQGSASGSLDAGGDTLHIGIFTGANGVTNDFVDSSEMAVFAKTADEAGALSLSCIVSLTNNQYIAVYFMNDTAAGTTLTLDHINFSIMQILHKD